MNTYALDFETYYDKEYSLKTLGTDAYVEDNRFDPYLLAVSGSDGFRWVGKPVNFDWEKINGHTWLSHNASFDERVYLQMQRDTPSLAGINPSDWHCTSNLSVFCQGPRSLAGASKQWLRKTVIKDVRDKMKGRAADELLKDQAALDYAAKDSDLCLEVWNHLESQWPVEERRLGRLTYQWGKKGVFIDSSRVNQSVDHLVFQLSQAEHLIPWAGERPPTSPKAMREACRDAGIQAPASFAMNDEAATIWFNTYSEQHPWIKAVRDFRRINMLLKKFNAVKRRIRPDGTMGYGMKYFGATPTGRWSGDAGVNMQNLPRGELFGTNLRKCIVPNPGNVFVSADLSQIEVRTLAWLSGDESYLQMMRDGYNPYNAAAQDLLGKRPEDVTPDEYQMLKGMILGCGYGMGEQKFRLQAPVLTGGKYAPSAAEARDNVRTYRTSKPKVINLWNALARDLKKSIYEEDQTYEIELPSGRSMKYFQPHITSGHYTAAIQLGGKRTAYHGGKLVENVSQAMARDIFAEGLLRIEDAGLPGRVALHVHDEVVFEVEESLASEVSAELLRLMCVTPDWCKGLPVRAEAKICKEYTK